MNCTKAKGSAMFSIVLDFFRLTWTSSGHELLVVLDLPAGDQIWVEEEELIQQAAGGFLFGDLSEKSWRLS